MIDLKKTSTGFMSTKCKMTNYFPYDAEVEWLFSEGRVGFPSVVIPKVDIQHPCQIEAEWEMTKVNYRHNRFVTFNGSTSDGEIILRNQNSINTREYVVYKGNVTSTGAKQNIPARSRDILTTDNANHVNVNIGSTGASYSFTASFLPYGPGDLCLWKSIGNGSYTAENGCGKIYYVRIICKGQMMLELKPVRVGDAGFFFDTVSQQLFGNTEIGTSDLVAGPDVASSSSGGGGN